MGKLRAIAGKLGSAWRGQREWRRLERLYRPSDGGVIVVFPHPGHQYNRIAADYLGELMSFRAARKALLLCRDADRERLIAQLPPPERLPAAAEICVACRSERAMGDMLEYYCMHEFHPAIFIVSLSEPHGNGGEELLGAHGIAARELIWICAHRMPPAGRVPDGSMQDNGF
jgi:hypothetical protein